MLVKPQISKKYFKCTSRVKFQKSRKLLLTETKADVEEAQLGSQKKHFKIGFSSRSTFHSSSPFWFRKILKPRFYFRSDNNNNNNDDDDDDIDNDSNNNNNDNGVYTTTKP